MTTSDLIREHLGDQWWEREHDGTAILAVLDRIMESFGGDATGAYGKIVFAFFESRSPGQSGEKFLKQIRILINPLLLKEWQ